MGDNVSPGGKVSKAALRGWRRLYRGCLWRQKQRQAPPQAGAFLIKPGDDSRPACAHSGTPAPDPKILRYKSMGSAACVGQAFNITARDASAPPGASSHAPVLYLADCACMRFQRRPEEATRSRTQTTKKQTKTKARGNKTPKQSDISLPSLLIPDMSRSHTPERKTKKKKKERKKANTMS